MSEGKRIVRQHPLEFKVDAVKLLEDQGYTVSEAANSLGILQAPQVNLTKWRTTGHGYFLRSQAIP